MRLTVPPELIEAARGGEGEGMERLLETLWPHAYRIARSVTHDGSIAEDAAQEACAIIYREISSLRSVQAFRVWAYRIVAREALRAAKSLRTTTAVSAAACEADPNVRVDVLRALSALPPDLRAVVVLTYYAGLNSAEVASALRIPGPTVRFRLAKARKRLAPLLDRNEDYSTLPEVC